MKCKYIYIYNYYVYSCVLLIHRSLFQKHRQLTNQTVVMLYYMFLEHCMKILRTSRIHNSISCVSVQRTSTKNEVVIVSSIFIPKTKSYKTTCSILYVSSNLEH